MYALVQIANGMSTAFHNAFRKEGSSKRRKLRQANHTTAEISRVSEEGLLMHLFRAARRGIAALVILAAIGTAVDIDAQPAPYVIETIMPMTGSAAFVGQAFVQTLQAFEKWANANGGVRGTPIHFDVHDDQSSPQVALELSNAAMARHVPVLMGSAVVATCATIGAAVENTGPVEYCFSPGYSPKQDSYAFASGPTINALTETSLTYAKNLGFKRLAFISSTDATGQAAARAERELLKQTKFAGMTQVADESISPQDVSASAQMAKIKAERPDALWTSASGTTFSTIMHAMSDAGLDIPVMTSTANANETQLKSIAAYLPIALYFNASPFQLGNALKDKGTLAQGKIFADAFKAIGVTPTALHTLGWDAPLLVLAALRQFGTTMTADQLKTYILSQRHFSGLSGYYDFSINQHGLGANSITMVGWDKSKAEFYPAAQPGGLPIKH